MINTPENINIFIAYAREDKAYLEELRVQLSILERIKLVDKIWYDGLIQAGTNWENEIHQALENSDIILLLVSADFIASDFCYDKEMKRAIELNETGKVRTIPIILRPCLWERTPLSVLEALPEGAFPIASTHWEDKDEPYKLVVEAIEKIILDLKAGQIDIPKEQNQASFTQWIEEAENLMAQEDWNKAQAQLREALHLYQKGFQPSLVTINRKIEHCQEKAEDQMYYDQNLIQGKKAYEEGAYETAYNYFKQALHFKPNATEALKLMQACKVSLVSTERSNVMPKEEKEPTIVIEKQTKPDRTKIFQVKIFGMEIFKLIIALCAVGIVGMMAIKMLSSGNSDNAYLSATFNEKIGRVEFIDLTKVKDPNGAIPEDAKIRTNYVDKKNPSLGLVAVKNIIGEWGYISVKEGNVITKIDFKYEIAWPHSEKEELAYVKRNGKCGFINLQGEEVIPLKYAAAASFQEGLAMVKKGDRNYAFINAKGTEVIANLDSVITTKFVNGEAWVIRGGKKILIDKKGTCLNGCDAVGAPNLAATARREAFQEFMKKAKLYAKSKRYEQALVVLKDAEKVATTDAEKMEVGNQIDLIGRKITAMNRAKVEELSKEAAADFKIGDYRSAASNYRKALEIENVTRLQEQLKICEKYIEKEAKITTPIYAFEHPSKLLGVKSQEGEVLLSPQFENALAYSNEMLAVEKDNKWGFVDLKGNIAIKLQYDQVSQFNSEGKAKAIFQGQKMLIDQNGNCLSCEQEDRSVEDYTRYFLKEGEKLRLDALDLMAKKMIFKVNRAQYAKTCNFGFETFATKQCKMLTKKLRSFGKITSRAVLKNSLEKYKKICEAAVQEYMNRGGIKYDQGLLDKILGGKRVIKIN
ncbi:MAG: WG repeat-containing protein [Saprospiraceae bacterium]